MGVLMYENWWNRALWIWNNMHDVFWVDIWCYKWRNQSSDLHSIAEFISCLSQCAQHEISFSKRLCSISIGCSAPFCFSSVLSTSTTIFFTRHGQASLRPNTDFTITWDMWLCLRRGSKCWENNVIYHQMELVSRADYVIIIWIID